MPKPRCKIGKALLSNAFLVLAIVSNLNPNTITPIIAGNVPKPKNDINTDPKITLPAVNDPANAKYTKPHGSTPLSIPTKKGYRWAPFLNAHEIKLEIEVKILLYIEDLNSSFSKSIDERKRVMSNMPANIDNVFWNPDTNTASPIKPNKAPNNA